MQLNERIATARAHRQLSQSQLALMMGVSRGACGQWEQGVSTPNTSHLITLAQVLEVRFEWLSTGRGEMEFEDGVREQSATYQLAGESMSADLKAVVAWIQRQPPARQRVIIKLLKTLTEFTDETS